MTIRAKKVDAIMDTLIFNPELWLAIGFLFLILEMTLDGSLVFFLPLGIGCAFTAAGLAGCSDATAGLCSIYGRWYFVMGSTAVGASVAALLLRKFTKKDKNRKEMNDY